MKKNIFIFGNLGSIALDVFIAIFLFLCLFPFDPWMPTPGGDPSWCFGISYLAGKQMAFGKDIVFTFGPLGILDTTAYDPSAYWMLFLSRLCFAGSFIFAYFLNFRKKSCFTRILFCLLAFYAVSTKWEGLISSYVVLAGNYVFTRTESKNNDLQKEDWRMTLCLAILFFPFILLFLTKYTFAANAFIAYIVSMIVFMKYGFKAKNVFVISIFLLCSLLVVWVALGQNLINLPLYIKNALPVCLGYGDAMSTYGPLSDIVVFLAPCAVMIYAIATEKKKSRLDKIMMAVLFLVALFLSFKHAFDRHDIWHLTISMTEMAFCGILLSIHLSNKKIRRTLIAVVFASMAIITVSGIFKSPSLYIEKLKLMSSDFCSLITLKIPSKAKLDAQFLNANKNVLALTEKIPLLEGSTDIYSAGQMTLIASGNTWNPRPIFQSYSAYTPSLVRMNRDHLLSENRPDNILFRLDQLDTRLPTLEDGLSHPVLLSDYVLTDFKGSYLYLRHRPPNERKEIKTIKTYKRDGILFQKVLLPDYSGIVMAKFTFHKNLLGHIATFLFKTSQIEAELLLACGEERTYRLIPSMTQTDFILSPLIENTSEFATIFSDPKILSAKDVVSVKIRPDRWSWLWKDAFEAEFTCLDY